MMTQECNNLDRQACCRWVQDLLRPEFFRALADPTRISVLLQVFTRPRECTVQEIARSCEVDLSVVSRHLQQLRNAGILDSRRQGREVFYAVKYGEIVKMLRDLASSIEACCPASREATTSPVARQRDA